MAWAKRRAAKRAASQKSPGDVDFVRTGHTFNEGGQLHLSPLLVGPGRENLLSGSKWTLDSNSRKSLNLAALVASIPPASGKQ